MEVSYQIPGRSESPEYPRLPYLVLCVGLGKDEDSILALNEFGTFDSIWNQFLEGPDSHSLLARPWLGLTPQSTTAEMRGILLAEAKTAPMVGVIVRR
jgi:hypothetical protein